MSQRIQKILKLKTDYKKGDNCLVTISDSHLMNHWSYGKYNERGINSDLITKFLILKEALLLSEKTYSPFIFCGDLLDQRVVDGVTLEYTSSFIRLLIKSKKENKIPGYILLGGNHELDDSAGNFSTLKHYSYFAENIITSPSVITFGNLNFICLPANQSIKEQLNTILLKYKNNPGLNILLLHGAIEGADLGSMRAPDGIAASVIEKCSKQFDWVICGDFHKYQIVNNLKNVYYCGSPNQMNLSDINVKHGYQLLNLSTNKINFIESDSPKFKIIEYVCGEYIHPWISDCIKYVDKIKNKIIIIKITGKLDQINNVKYDDIKNRLLQHGAYGVFKELNIIKEFRNSTKISNELSINEIINKYVENKDFDKSVKIKERHKLVLQNFARKSYAWN